MSGFWDFAEGNILGRRAGYDHGERAVAQTARNYQGVINQWAAHAEDLKERLAGAEKHALKLEAELFAKTELARRLREELARAAPHSQLLDDDVLMAIQKVALAKFYSKHGYTYDPVTCKLTKE